MNPYYQDGGITIYAGDCLEVMPTLPAESVDAIVTDPPYGLKFMGKDWDHGVPGVHFWEAAYRVAKPGAHLLAFGGTRTSHRLVCAIEDAGWEIRDTIMWVYGSGFPKSLDVSKAIDKEAGVERATVGTKITGNAKQRTSRTGEFADGKHGGQQVVDVTDPATEAAKQWAGWGTALKPAVEPIVLARKPLVGTVAANVQRYGTGALNIDASRIPTEPNPKNGVASPGMRDSRSDFGGGMRTDYSPLGRWPANLIHDGSEEVLECFPETEGGERPARRGGIGYKGGGAGTNDGESIGYDSGNAARFFYCAKASRSDRYSEAGNDHPTVKPEDLMRYLIRLITPPGGVVLDPFLGSGTTSKAAHSLGFRCIGIDLDEKHCEIAAKRLTQGVLDFGGTA